jgi:hypothetical protein
LKQHWVYLRSCGPHGEQCCGGSHSACQSMRAFRFNPRNHGSPPLDRGPPDSHACQCSQQQAHRAT